LITFPFFFFFLFFENPISLVVNKKGNKNPNKCKDSSSQINLRGTESGHGRRVKRHGNTNKQHTCLLITIAGFYFLFFYFSFVFIFLFFVFFFFFDYFMSGWNLLLECSRHYYKYCDSVVFSRPLL
jgi:hypothetical protein